MSWLGLYNLAEWVIRLVMFLVILRRRLAPATALAWLSVIFVLPPVGLLFYLLFGQNRLARKRIALHRQIISDMRSEPRLARRQELVIRPQMDPALQPFINQAESIGGMPIIGGNQVELLAETQLVIDRLIADIDAAKHHVHLLFYIFSNDATGKQVVDALVRAAGRGVKCRVLADAAGSRSFFKRTGFAAYLNANKVETRPMLPVDPIRRGLARLDLRNHRKLAIIDGRIAYTGSQNIVDSDYGHKRAGTWIDMTGRFVGPIVSQLQVVFLEDWLFETKEELESPWVLPPLKAVGEITAQAVPTGPDEDGRTFRLVLLAAINAAQRKIIITSPYLALDESTFLALSMAVLRGVEVNIIIPARTDHPLVGTAGRSFYEPLLNAGVNVYEYQLGLLHAKTMTVDDAFALLGSSNLDIRSFDLNFELSVMMYGPQITHELRFAQSSYLNDSKQVTLEWLHSRSTVTRYLEYAASLISPLL